MKPCALCGKLTDESAPGPYCLTCDKISMDVAMDGYHELGPRLASVTCGRSYLPEGLWKRIIYDAGRM